MQNDVIQRREGDVFAPLRLVLVALILFVALYAPGGGARAGAETARPDPFAAEHVPGILLVILRDQSNAPVLRLNDLDTLTYQPLTESYILATRPKGEREAYARLLAEPRVAFVEPNYRIHAALTPNDPGYPQQTWTKSVNLEAAWNVTTGAPEVVIGLVDSGVEADHPDLRGRVLPGYNAITKDTNTADTSTQRHGTQVALIAAGRGNDGVGIAGVAWNVRILPVRVIDDNGASNSQIAADGIHWAADHGATVINLSSDAVTEFSLVVARQVAYARSKGVTVVAAAGNDPKRRSYPANDANVITVGATKADDTPADFSSALGKVDLAAPGVDIPTYLPDLSAGLPTYTGTSLSAPIVTGIVALMQSVRPGLRQEDALAILKQTARDVGPPGPDAQTGAGIPDAAKALQALLANPASSIAAAAEPYRAVYDRYDGPLASGAAQRGYIWGPLPAGSTFEPYANAPGGQRQVWYFDKGRLELTNPQSGQITSGLLVTELISGEMQVGDTQRVRRDPANIRVAGDNLPGMVTVTYASLQSPRGAPPRPVGSPVTEQLNANGARVPAPQTAGYGVTTATLVPETNHSVASVFQQFLNSSGVTIQNGQATSDRLFDPAYFVVGLPITEPYWITAIVGGQPRDVLIQAFERRVLTYTPANPDAFKVELGNVGLHYVQWRYGGL